MIVGAMGACIEKLKDAAKCEIKSKVPSCQIVITFYIFPHNHNRDIKWIPPV